MKNIEIKPILAGLDVEDYWQESDPGMNDEGPSPGDSVFGTDPNVRWFVEYRVGLLDSNRNKHILSKHKKPLFEDKYVEFTVCSPAFQKMPHEEYRGNLSNALVQNTLSEDDATRHIELQLNGITAKNELELESRLAHLMNFL